MNLIKEMLGISSSIRMNARSTSHSVALRKNIDNN
jgi:hypothetical protein